MRKSDEYQRQLLETEEATLQTQLPLIPIVLSSVNDLSRAGYGLLIVAVAGLFVEGAFLYNFLRETIQLQLWLAALMTVGLITVLSGGGKRVLDSIYDDVLAAVQATGATVKNALRQRAAARLCDEARRRHRRIRKTMNVTGWSLFMAGIIALAVERVQIELFELDELSWLAFLYNTLLLLGAALVSSAAFHEYSKRNSEVEQIENGCARIEDIQAEKVELLYEDNDDDPNPEEGSQNAHVTGESPLRPAPAAAASTEKTAVAAGRH